MQLTLRFLLGALAAIAVVSIGAGTAGALRSIEFGTTRSETRSMSRALTIEGGGVRAVCEVTLLKELFTVAKTRGARAGTARLVANERTCTGGRLRPLNTIEGWTVTYQSFTGTLPNITSVRFEILAFAFLIQAFGGLGDCLYRGNAQVTTGPGTNVTELRFDATIALPLSRDLTGLFCPGEVVLRGTGTLGTTGTMRLI
jgi:hypothetical protein